LARPEPAAAASKSEETGFLKAQIAGRNPDATAFTPLFAVLFWDVVDAMAAAAREDVGFQARQIGEDVGVDEAVANAPDGFTTEVDDIGKVLMGRLRRRLKDGADDGDPLR
jgi:cytochrome b